MGEWEGQGVWVNRRHACQANPGEATHDGTVRVAHIRGRGDVVYHTSLEAAEAKEPPHGKIPSGSLSTVLCWDTKRGAKGWARLTWRGGEVFVRQAHVEIVGAEAFEAVPVRVAHIEGREDVVYHTSLEAA